MSPLIMDAALDVTAAPAVKVAPQNFVLRHQLDKSSAMPYNSQLSDFMLFTLRLIRAGSRAENC